MRTRALLSLALVVPFLVSVAPAESVGAAGPTCHGRRATIVGNGTRAVLYGTRGPDVIVSRGSAYVVPGRGDDLVCITRSRGTQVQVADNLGGDDRVYVQSRNVRMYARLGPGRDVYRGGSGPDLVRGHGGLDDIATGQGQDAVYTGGRDGVGDRIDLGPDGDYVEVLGSRNRGGRIDGGDGVDRIFVVPTLGDTAVVDVPAEVMEQDGSRVLAFSGLEDFRVAPDFGGRLRFTGGDAGEHVDAIGTARVDADLGGGNDRIEVGLPNGGGGAMDVDGGSGSDSVRILGHDVHVDVAAGTATLETGVPAVTFRGFTAVHGYGEDVLVEGTVGDDRLSGSGCRVEVRGGAGADRLQLFTESYGTLDCSAGESGSLYGGDGDDTLVGAFGDDYLDGGADVDSADGYPGDDTCLAETRVACEH